MTYPSFEGTAGELLDQVEANSYYLTNGGSFDSTSMVTRTNVDIFATNAYGFVVMHLLANGYGTTPANATIQQILTTIQALDTTVQVENSVPYDEKGDPNVRYRGYAARRDAMIETFITKRALGALGQTVDTDGDRSSFLELTGRSISRSDDVYSDTDIWQPRFPRGFHDKKVGGGSSGGAAD